MSKPSDYWVTFWVSQVIRASKHEYICWGIAVEDNEISAVLIEQVDGSRIYFDDKTIVEAAKKQLEVQLYKPKKKK